MLNLLSAMTLPLIGEVNLSTSLTIVFFICLLAVIGFEFVNGFHDTANAVATVIYTRALKPVYAIPWSGTFNFLGVFLGGVAVAMSVLKLLPIDNLMTLPTSVGACFVLSVLLASIIWNLGTWYLGIPKYQVPRFHIIEASNTDKTKHAPTLVGSVIRLSIGNSFNTLMATATPPRKTPRKLNVPDHGMAYTGFNALV